MKDLARRLSLTTKSVLVTVAIGICLWALLDYVQSSRLKKIFYVNIIEELTRQSVKDRTNFNRLIQSYHKGVVLFTSQENLRRYIKDQDWSSDENISVRYYDQVPPWLPKLSVMRLFTLPSYSLLLDSKGRVREVYQVNPESVDPQYLQNPSSLLLSQSNKQSFIANEKDSYYLYSSEHYVDENGARRGSLMLASPLDSQFLAASAGSAHPGSLTALATGEGEAKILASSKPDKAPAGVSIDDLKGSYLITGQEFLYYGAAESIINLLSLIPMADVDKMTNKVIATGRFQRNVIAPIFIITFALIMSWVVKRINGLSQTMSEFSSRMLGTKKVEQAKGDQLYFLEQRFKLLTEDVIEAREVLKRESEEKTSLIVNNVLDAIVTLDSEGNIITWNPPAEKIFGWTRQEVVGKPVVDTIIPLSYREDYKKGLDDFYTTGESVILDRQVQIPALHRDGQEFPVEFSLSPAKSEGNFFFIAIIRDITERKKAEEQIRLSLNEKELLLREIHHRVKNNMQIISSLLRLQSRHLGDEKYIEVLNESENRIKSMALVHEKLYKSDDLADIDFEGYIKSLAKSLFAFYDINTGKVALGIDASGVTLGIDSAIPCGLIINELMSNALKHAFPGGREGTINVLFKTAGEAGSKEYELRVSDNGVGISDGFDILNTNTFGLQLVTSLVGHQLQGSLEFESSGGTEVVVTFADLNYKSRI